MSPIDMAQNPIKKGEQTKIVTVRMAESDYKSVQIRAEAASMTIAEYIRLLVLDAERLRDYVSDAKSLSLSLTDYVSDAKIVSDKIQKVMASMETENQDEDDDIGEQVKLEGLGMLFE